MDFESLGATGEEACGEKSLEQQAHGARPQGASNLGKDLCGKALGVASAIGSKLGEDTWGCVQGVQAL